MKNNIDNSLRNKLEEVVHLDAKNSDLKRENGNVDGDTSMAKMLQLGSISSKSIVDILLNETHHIAHKNGDIHIHDLDFAAIGTTTCNQIPLDKLFKGGFFTGHGHLREPNSIATYAALTAIAIQSNQNDQHGGQSIPALDYYLAPGIIKSFYKRLKENMSKFLEIQYSLEADESNLRAETILNKYGDIRSIELSQSEKDKMKIIILGELLTAGIGIEDGTETMKQGDRMLDFAINKSLKEVERDTFQAMEGLIHNLNTMHSRAGAQIPFSSINFGTNISPEGRMVSKNLLLAQEKGLGNGETAIFPILIFKVKNGINVDKLDPNYDLFKLACRVSSKRMFPNFAFLDAPHNLQYYKEGDIDTEVAYMGCRTRTVSNINGPEIVTGRGNLSFTSINLPRIAIKYMSSDRTNPDLNGFFRELDEWIEVIINQLIDRFNYQSSLKVKNFPFLMGQGNWLGSSDLNDEDTLKDVLKHGSLTVGFIGLAETLIALTGKHHGECDKSQKLGLEIISHMRKRMDEATQRHHLNFALIATPAEGLSGRFVAMDKEKYGIIEGVTDKEYYTNSFHIPVYYKTSAFNKIEKEAPYHALTNGGHISYVELDGDTSKNPEAFERVVLAMKDSGIGYGSINHPIDIDPVCGYQGVIIDECPKCGRKESEDGIPYQHIRRITGYLTGTLDRFNNAKKAEERDRQKHV